MTNEEVTALLRAAQKLWARYRDDPPDYHDMKAWNVVIAEANAPLEGLPDHCAAVMEFFVEELNQRSRKRYEGGNV